MKLNDIEKLPRDLKQDNLYDLFTKTYIDFPSTQASEYIVDRDEEMRMDLISYRIYGNANFVDFLCNFNQIDNPLNIKQGDKIRYIDSEQIALFSYDQVAPEIQKKGLLNVNKASRKDPARQQFVEDGYNLKDELTRQGYSLPPNFKDAPTQPVRIVENTLTITS